MQFSLIFVHYQCLGISAHTVYRADALKQKKKEIIEFEAEKKKRELHELPNTKIVKSGVLVIYWFQGLRSVCLFSVSDRM